MFSLNSNNSKDDMFGMYDKVKHGLSERFNEIREEFITHVLKSEYYNKNILFLKRIEDPRFLNFEPLSDEKGDITRSILNEIEMNNETTLIGTLNFSNFAEVRDPRNLYPICDNVQNFIDIKHFRVDYPKEGDLEEKTDKR